MENLPNRKPNRIKNYDYSQRGSYFVTICTKDRKKLLSEIRVGTPVLGCPQVNNELVYLKEYGQIADRCIKQLNKFYTSLSVDNYVIMPDHVHLLITIHSLNGHPGTGVPTRTSEIGRLVGTFKRFCNKKYGENIWQDRYYDHVVRNQQDYNEIWEYINYNPRKYLLMHTK